MGSLRKTEWVDRIFGFSENSPVDWTRQLHCAQLGTLGHHLEHCGHHFKSRGKGFRRRTDMANTWNGSGSQSGRNIQGASSLSTLV